jgi:hypothetical protein
MKTTVSNNMELMQEMDHSMVNIKYFKIPATKTALRLGYDNCIERHMLYKSDNTLVITRHTSSRIEGIFEEEDTYYYVYNGVRLSTAKR